MAAWFVTQFRKARKAGAQCDTFGSSAALWWLPRSGGLVLSLLLLCTGALALPLLGLLLHHLSVSRQGIVPHHSLELEQQHSAGGVGHHPGAAREEPQNHRRNHRHGRSCLRGSCATQPPGPQTDPRSSPLLEGAAAINPISDTLHILTCALCESPGLFSFSSTAKLI